MPSKHSSIHIPHLISFCDQFELRNPNRHCRSVTAASKKWAIATLALNDDERRGLPGLELGLLASLCYPTCDSSQLLLVTQFLILMVRWVDRTTSLDAAAFDQIWGHLSRTSHPAWQRRFQGHLHAFRMARSRAARDNEAGITADLESYITLRQDSSGVKLLFDLIEYAVGLHISSEAYASPILSRLRHDAVNIVAWSSDVASYAQKQARGDRHNLVAVLMEEKRLTAQGASDAAGALIKDMMDMFHANEQTLLSEHAVRLNPDVRRYVQGLRDWIVGFMHWIYNTERFFGESAEEVRAFGWVFLPPNMGT
ncbi:terpenoid synthase [Obba rivulosa]|uniref:Terpene synthase n=1 Tax=Obba rivulosa TaxID=1052685 RepID=A0A8E2ALV1_9APHY|nr:terpenoid synthase [Obba rivulosa]